MSWIRTIWLANWCLALVPQQVLGLWMRKGWSHWVYSASLEITILSWAYPHCMFNSKFIGLSNSVRKSIWCWHHLPISWWLRNHQPSLNQLGWVLPGMPFVHSKDAMSVTQGLESVRVGRVWQGDMLVLAGRYPRISGTSICFLFIDDTFMDNIPTSSLLKSQRSVPRIVAEPARWRHA